MNFNDIIKNGGKSELVIGDVKYTLFGADADEGRLIRLIVTNVNIIN